VKILVTGNSVSSGSWAIRAEQLGRAVGATVVPRAADPCGYDVCVAGVPYVWDIVDPWPQPQGNAWGDADAKAWLHRELLRTRPDLVLAATRAMAADIQSFGFRAVCVPHHHRDSCAPIEVRETLSTVVYDGSLVQLGAWATTLRDQCEERGWRLVAGHLTTEEYRSADIVVALRDGAGYAPRTWKSGVKLANAQACGIPFIASPESGYKEQAVPGVERFVSNQKELSAAFDALTPAKERRRVSGWMLAASAGTTLPVVAQAYAAALSSVVKA
jgi:hypothetical protein